MRTLSTSSDELGDHDAPKGAKRPTSSKAVSLTDPQAVWATKRRCMKPVFVYNANYLIDNKLGVIVDAEGTRANRIEENRVCAIVSSIMAREFFALSRCCNMLKTPKSIRVPSRPASRTGHDNRPRIVSEKFRSRNLPHLRAYRQQTELTGLCTTLIDRFCCWWWACG